MACSSGPRFCGEMLAPREEVWARRETTDERCRFAGVSVAGASVFGRTGLDGVGKVRLTTRPVTGGWVASGAGFENELFEFYGDDTGDSHGED